VQGVHQVIALLEIPDLDGYERSLLEWSRDSLYRVQSAPTPDAWLKWYRETLGAINQLSERLGQQKSSNLVATGPSDQDGQARLARMRDCHTAFLQRWNVRLQDQGAAVKTRLLDDVGYVPIEETGSQSHLNFAVAPGELQRFADHVFSQLSAWSVDVEAKLTPSWHQHVGEQAAREGMTAAARPPPQWTPIRLGASPSPLPRIDGHGVRRPTLFIAVMRVFRSIQSIFTMIGMLFATVFVALATDKSGVLRGVITGLFGFVALLVGGGVGIYVGKRSMADEIAQARIDNRQRLHGVIKTWVGTVVDAHRTRMQGLIASVGPEMKGRLGQWIEESWGSSGANQRFFPAKDHGPLLLTLNTARNGIAMRVAQLEYEMAASQQNPDSGTRAHPEK